MIVYVIPSGTTHLQTLSSSGRPILLKLWTQTPTPVVAFLFFIWLSQSFFCALCPCSVLLNRKSSIHSLRWHIENTFRCHPRKMTEQNHNDNEGNSQIDGLIHVYTQTAYPRSTLVLSSSDFQRLFAASAYIYQGFHKVDPKPTGFHTVLPSWGFSHLSNPILLNLLLPPLPPIRPSTYG